MLALAGTMKNERQQTVLIVWKKGEEGHIHYEVWLETWRQSRF